MALNFLGKMFMRLILTDKCKYLLCASGRAIGQVKNYACYDSDTHCFTGYPLTGFSLDY
jgi:hypothetical protein